MARRGFDFDRSRNAAAIIEHLAKLPEGPDPETDLALLTHAVEAMPAPVHPNTRQDRTIPARIGMASRNDHRAGRLFTPALYAGDKTGQLVLPGFAAHTPDLPTPALPLALYDLGIGQGVEQRGRGAPLALRLWIEAVLSVGIQDRMHGGPVAMEVTLRDLLKRLYPRRRPKPNEYWPRLMAAVEALESPEARIPFEDPDTGGSGLQRVVLVSRIPRGESALDDKVRLIVDLPPGSRQGPVLSPDLPWWGLKSAPAYRALIGLAFRWWEPGRTHHPVGKGKRRHWIEAQDPARYGKPLTDAEVIALCFPTSTRAQRRKLAHEAWRVLKALVDAGEARDVDGRLLPPKRSGVSADV